MEKHTNDPLKKWLVEAAEAENAPVNDEIWAAIEPKIRRPHRRRGLIFWLFWGLGAGFLMAGAAAFWFLKTEKAATEKAENTPLAADFRAEKVVSEDANNGEKTAPDFNQMGENEPFPAEKTVSTVSPRSPKKKVSDAFLTARSAQNLLEKLSKKRATERPPAVSASEARVFQKPSFSAKDDLLPVPHFGQFDSAAAAANPALAFEKMTSRPAFFVAPLAPLPFVFSSEKEAVEPPVFSFSIRFFEPPKTKKSRSKKAEFALGFSASSVGLRIDPRIGDRIFLEPLGPTEIRKKYGSWAFSSFFGLEKPISKHLGWRTQAIGGLEKMRSEHRVFGLTDPTILASLQPGGSLLIEADFDDTILVAERRFWTAGLETGLTIRPFSSAFGPRLFVGGKALRRFERGATSAAFWAFSLKSSIEIGLGRDGRFSAFFAAALQPTRLDWAHFSSRSGSLGVGLRLRIRQ